MVFLCIALFDQAFPLPIPPPATPLSNTSVEGLVIPSGVWVPVLISEPEYWLPPPRLPPELEPLLPEEEPLLPPDLLEAPLLELPLLEPPLLDALREALRPPPERELPEPPFLAADFLAPPF